MNRVYVNATTAAVLMHNALTSAGRHDDAQLSFSALRHKMDKAVVGIEMKVLEKLLYHANLNAETEGFWHPDGMEFSKFANSIIPAGYYYDRRYNLILRREK